MMILLHPPFMKNYLHRDAVQDKKTVINILFFKPSVSYLITMLNICIIFSMVI